MFVGLTSLLQCKLPAVQSKWSQCMLHSLSGICQGQVLQPVTLFSHSCRAFAYGCAYRMMLACLACMLLHPPLLQATLQATSMLGTESHLFAGSARCRQTPTSILLRCAEGPVLSTPPTTEGMLCPMNTSPCHPPPYCTDSCLSWHHFSLRCTSLSCLT